ncbi:unnamed protein product, partial [Adineta steineri]
RINNDPFQQLANKEFSDEDTKIIERLCELAKTTVDGAISQMFLYLPDLFRTRQEESVFFIDNMIN